MTIETGDKAYVNANDTLYSYLGIMRAMQDVAERQVILGEIRGDLVTSTEYTTDTLYAISNFDNPQDQTCSMLQVSDYYNVINNCNFYIHNCDTSAIKSNIKYMIPEYAQVKAIRAWAYLQLVKNYKEVPYITEPVSNLSVVRDFDYKNNLVSKDNLVDKLIEDGILNFVDTKYPGYGSGNNYGSWENGSEKIISRLCYIPIRAILGDLYLLRGGSQSDYEKAAKYYFDYLKNEKVPQPLSYIEATNYRNGTVSGLFNNDYGYWGETYSYTDDIDVISLIPSSSNAGIGKMLTRVSDIFGYTPTSSQSSDEKLNDDNEGTGEYEASGSVSVKRNYKRQYGPSEAYNDVVNDQTAIFYVRQSNNQYSTIPSYIPNYDARNELNVENYAYEGEGYPLCSKAARGNAFFYTIPIYRKSLIWLRLAEAINRAGYPEFAFGILKDGLNKYNLPTIGDEYRPVFAEINGNQYNVIENKRDGITVYADYSGDVIQYYYYDEDNNFVIYPDDVKGTRWEMKTDTIPNNEIYYSSYGALYYVNNIDQLASFNNFLSFNDDTWNSTYGIHAHGAGFGHYTSSNTGHYITNITGLLDDVSYAWEKELGKQGIEDATLATKEDLVNAVENIIVDELALETAFEGNRFNDLVRIADHKNAAGQNGTEWLAKKIANRGSRKATVNTPAIENFDAAIYAKLQNQANWYFQLPAWSTK